MAAAQTQPAGACVVLLDGVPVDQGLEYFTDSDDEEPPTLEESTTFKWDEFILRAPDDESAKRSLRKLRKAGSLVRMMSSLTGALCADSSVDEIQGDFASKAEGLAAGLAKRYGDAATEHLAQLLAEIEQFGLCEDLDEGLMFPPSHADVGDELARRVSRVLSEELKHFRKDSTWSADESAPQVGDLLRSLRELDDVQLEQVTFVTEQTARRAHIAKVQEIEKKLDGFRTVAMAAQGAEAQQLWNEWQQKEDDLLRRVSEAEAAAAEAAQRAATARRMYESAEELAKKKQQEKDRVNKQLGTEARVVIERNRRLQRERDSLLSEVSKLEDELAQKRRRHEVLCAQRQQALDLRARGVTGTRLGDEGAGHGAAHNSRTDTGAAQAKEKAAAYLEELRVMKARLHNSVFSNADTGATGLHRQAPEFPAEMSDSSPHGEPSGLIRESIGSVDGATTPDQPYRSFAESMDDAYSATRTPLRRAHSEQRSRESRAGTSKKSADVKFGRRSSPSPSNHDTLPSESGDRAHGAGVSTPLARAVHQQRQQHKAKVNMGAMRRHKSTPSPVSRMIKRSNSSGKTVLPDNSDMIISKDGKLAMERPSIKVAALNNDYATQALADLRASIAAAAEGGSNIDEQHADQKSKVAVAARQAAIPKLRQTTSAALPSSTEATNQPSASDANGVGGVLAAALGGSDHLVPPLSRMTVAVSPGSVEMRRSSSNSSDKAPVRR